MSHTFDPLLACSSMGRENSCSVNCIAQIEHYLAPEPAGWKLVNIGLVFVRSIRWQAIFETIVLMLIEQPMGVAASRTRQRSQKPASLRPDRGEPPQLQDRYCVQVAFT